MLRSCSFLLALGLAACERSSPTVRDSKAPPGQASPVDACALLARDEVAKIQNTSIAETNNTVRTDGLFVASQCTYAAAENIKSVGLTLSRQKPGGGSPREFWQRKFEAYRTARTQEQKDEQEGVRGEEEADEGRLTPPRKIENLGEEAYWVRGTGGALYVLEGDEFFRVSIGGGEDEDVKMTRATALATKALPRLQTISTHPN